MKAKDVQPGDVYGESLMVRDVDPVTEPGKVRLLLSQGRTDPGAWSKWIDPERDLDVTRMEGRSL